MNAPCPYCKGWGDSIGSLMEGTETYRCRFCGMTWTDDAVEEWEPDREYQIGYAHACGYKD